MNRHVPIVLVLIVTCLISENCSRSLVVPEIQISVVENCNISNKGVVLKQVYYKKNGKFYRKPISNHG